MDLRRLQSRAEPQGLSYCAEGLRPSRRTRDRQVRAGVGGPQVPDQWSSPAAGSSGRARGDDPACGAAGLRCDLCFHFSAGSSRPTQEVGSIHPPPSPCPLVLCAGSQFALKVLVRDAVTRQPLSGAAVDVYVNHMLNGSAYMGAPAGDALLQVPYSPALSLTLLGRKDGYLPGLQPWSATQRPRE